MQRAKTAKPSMNQSKRAGSRQQSNAPSQKPRKASNNSNVPSGYARPLSHRFVRTTGPNGDIVVGTDLLGILSGNAAASNAATCFRVPCSPSFWAQTRVATESRLFGVYTPKKITLHWQPAVGTTTTGAIVMGTLDVANAISGAFSVNALLASRGGVVSAVWKDCKCEMDLSGLTQRAYHLNDISEDGNPLNVYVVLPDALSNAGYLWVDYIFEFKLAQTLQGEYAIYNLTPVDLTLTNASTTLNSTTGLTAGEHGVFTANGKASYVYRAYLEVGMTNVVADMGRLGLRQDFQVLANGTDVNLLEGTALLYGKSGLVVSVYPARAVGGSF
jgi:hypothetical protein